MNFGTVVINGRTRGAGKGAGIRSSLEYDISKRNNRAGIEKLDRMEKEDEDRRVPEIQMINKFYGLIPKKFLISERIRPSILLIRQKSSTVRPKTTKPTSTFHADYKFPTEDPKLKGIRRCSSVDETKLEPSLDTPLVTRRISFEKAPPRTNNKANTEELVSESTIIAPNNKSQRILRIDLSQMKWDEDNEDGIINSPRRKEGSPSEIKECPKHGFGFHNERKLSKDENLKILSPARPGAEGSDEKTSEIAHWTAGKTTEERRAKLQKSFSIHPSFSKFSLNSQVQDSLDYAESETASEVQFYPESMTRTGRRSLHVESRMEDVETMVSSRKVNASLSNSIDNDNLTKAVFIPTAVSSRLLQPQRQVLAQAQGNKLVPQPQALPFSNQNTFSPKDTRQNQAPKNSLINGGGAKFESEKLLSATEKRKLFSQQRCVSLPSAKEFRKSEFQKKSKVVVSLIRQNSSTTKPAIKSGLIGKSLSKSGKSGTGVSVFRPKTAPTITSHKESQVTKNRRQPIMRATSGVNSPNGTHSKGKEGECRMSMMKGSGSSSSAVKGEEKKKNAGAQEAQSVDGAPEAEATAALANSLKTLPRRSFSLDEASLLNYSTSITDSIESIENSLQSSKRREECLRIYERMKNGGCAVRLQTIFRGLMTPSEYRTFIAAAEKAATEAGTGRSLEDDQGIHHEKESKAVGKTASQGAGTNHDI